MDSWDCDPLGLPQNRCWAAGPKKEEYIVFGLLQKRGKMAEKYMKCCSKMKFGGPFSYFLAILLLFRRRPKTMYSSFSGPEA